MIRSPWFPFPAPSSTLPRFAQHNWPVQSRLLAALLTIFLLLAGSASATAQRPSPDLAPDTCWLGERPALRPGDQLWLISTRHLGCPVWEGPGQPNLLVMRYDDYQGWQAADLASFFAADDPQQITMFYVHGNRVDSDTALQRGWSTYHTLTESAGTEKSVRYVIWSWPSNQVPGPLRDFRVKADRTDADGYYLGWVLSRIHPEERVSLLGFSFGARVITGSLHMLGGGTLNGLPLSPGARPPGRGVRVVLMGAAMPNYWLLPGSYHGQARRQIDRMLLIYNSCDAVLKHYHLVERCNRPEALGYTGLFGMGHSGGLGGRIDQHDVCCLIGREHREVLYYASPVLVSAMSHYTMWEPVGGR